MSQEIVKETRTDQLGNEVKNKKIVYSSDSRAEFPAWNTGILHAYLERNLSKDPDLDNVEFRLVGRDRTDSSVNGVLEIFGIKVKDVVPGIRSLIDVLEDLISQLPGEFQENNKD